jgi:hypothetical protein
MDAKDPIKFTSPNKPLERSTMNQDGIQEIYYGMEKKITENREKMQQNMERNMEQIELNMDVNLEHMEKKIIEALNDILPKIDKVCEDNHGNKGSA